jgi:hypothetical protein
MYLPARRRSNHGGCIFLLSLRMQKVSSNMRSRSQQRAAFIYSVCPAYRRAPVAATLRFARNRNRKNILSICFN